MTTIARKVLNQWDNDNMVLDRLVERDTYQQFYPIGVDNNWEKEQCAYVFEDGSALIHESPNNWEVITQYGTHRDLEIYSNRIK
jgi:hypothetical protein